MTQHSATCNNSYQKRFYRFRVQNAPKSFKFSTRALTRTLLEEYEDLLVRWGGKYLLPNCPFPSAPLDASGPNCWQAY